MLGTSSSRCHSWGFPYLLGAKPQDCPRLLACQSRGQGYVPSDVVIFSIRGPPKSRPIPQDRFLIPSRFLTVPGPGEGP
eukprot:7321627-Pyramimonas_sp.AAC.1